MATVLTSAAVTLLITAVEITVDYRDRTNRVITAHEEIERIHGHTIIENLWMMNDVGAELTVKSIAELDTVEYISLTWDGGDKITGGVLPAKAEYISEYPLYRLHRGDKRKIGTLTLHSSFATVRYKLFVRYCYLLLANFFKSIVVSVVALALFHLMATRHIRDIAEYASSVDLFSPPKPLKLARKKNKSNQTDELQTLADSVNDMVTRLYASHARVALRKEDLETELKQQSHQLQTAQQRLLEKDRLTTIGSLVALVAHELRNPLGTIKSSIMLLQKTLPDEQLTAMSRQVMSRMERSVLRCDHTIENLRGFGAQRENQQTLFDLGDLVDHILNTEPNDWNEFQFQLQVQDKTPILADKLKVTQVICNLLTNASQATLSQPAPCSISANIHVQRQGESAVFQLEDCGAGLGDLEPERLFDPLFTTKVAGFGMGLSLSRYFVEELKGELYLESSNKTGGAIATLRLPIAQSDRAYPAIEQWHQTK